MIDLSKVIEWGSLVLMITALGFLIVVCVWFAKNIIGEKTMSVQMAFFLAIISTLTVIMVSTTIGLSSQDKSLEIIDLRLEETNILLEQIKIKIQIQEMETVQADSILTQPKKL